MTASLNPDLKASDYTTATHTTASVTTASGTVLAANTGRVYALIINDSDTTIYLKIGATAVASQGIRLNANGGSYEIGHAWGNLTHQAIYGIHAGTGTKMLLVLEAT